MSAKAFECLAEADIPEIAARTSRFRHRQTGAVLLWLATPDPVCTFTIAFRTPPPDSTGIVHILEHCVLSGSRRYPVRKPYVEMLKGSLQSYLNASTYPDLTLFPVASAHPQDFANLVDVYLDAVFYPLLTVDSFRREAWRLSLPAAGAPLVMTGVVLNEMRGAMSAPLALLDEHRRRALYPDTPYAHAHGGDPGAISELDHAALRRFHRAHYHPGNALIVMSGDSDLEVWLDRLDPVLTGARRGPLAPAPLRQPRFDAPRRYATPFPAPAETTGYLAVSWMLPDDSVLPDEILFFEIFTELLVGSPDALFRRAISRHGFADDVLASGLIEDTTPPAFSLCLGGVAPDSAEAVERAILAILSDLADGLDLVRCEAAIGAVVLRRAIRNDPVRPEGVGFALNAARAWCRGDDPAHSLHFASACDDLRRRVRAGEPVFETQIRRTLLDNPHRVTLTLTPDPDMARRQTAAHAARLKRIEVGLTRADRAALIWETARLDAEASTPEPAAALATIPTLRLTDLARDRTFPVPEAIPVKGATILWHPLRTKGLAYLDLGFDLRAVLFDDLPLVPLLGLALIEFSAEDDVRLGLRIARETGGIVPQVWSATAFGGGCRARLFLRGAARIDRLGPLAAILSDILHASNTGDPRRLLCLTTHEIARVERCLIPRGHETVDRLLRAQMHPAGRVDEATAGLRYLAALRSLHARLRRGEGCDWLPRLARALICADGTVCTVTADPVCRDAAIDAARHLLETLPRQPAPIPAAESHPTGPEAYAFPSATSFVGRGFNLRKLDATPGTVAAGVAHLSLTWLWEVVRERGGAYGAQAHWDPAAGLMRIWSYRDPQLLATLDAFEDCAAYLARGQGGPALTRCIIGAVGTIDRPRHPSAEGFAATTDWLRGDMPERRTRWRHELLDTTGADLRRLGHAMRDAVSQPYVTVLGPREALEQALDARPNLFAIRN